jgi:hypothetical protein
MRARASAQNRPEIRYAWCGPAVLVSDNRGRIGVEELTGFFFRETRYLSSLRLEIAGEVPFPCSLATAGPHELEFSYIYPPVESQGGGGSGSGGSGERHGILFRGLDLDLRCRVRPSSFEAVLRLTSRWNERVEIDLAWVLGADYAGLSEVQAGQRQQEAEARAEAVRNGVRFRYGHDRLPLETHVSVEGGTSWQYVDGRLTSRLALARQQPCEIRLAVHAVDREDPIDGDGEARREQRLRGWHAEVTRLHAPAETPLVGLAEEAMHELGSIYDALDDVL